MNYYICDCSLKKKNGNQSHICSSYMLITFKSKDKC